ncbi:hypothetical protein [Billgrantia sp. C5P2]|uniref:hypothetical protein n=1 Tax=Billgrantia sp. C5P2 TaxID=3436239 RepID=UPI003DA6BCC7
MSLMLPLSSVADEDWWFSPDFCEFSVEFPTAYEEKQVVVGGELGAGATAQVGSSAFFAAECWSYEEQPPLEQFAQHMEMLATQRGVSVSSVVVDRSSTIGGQVVLTGVVNAGGETLHITTISSVGQRTRLDLTMVDNEIVSREKLAFRNSITLKN